MTSPAAYKYRDRLYCAHCIPPRLFADGAQFVIRDACDCRRCGGREETTEEYLDELAYAIDIYRADSDTFSSDAFPKPVERVPDGAACAGCSNPMVVAA